MEIKGSRLGVMKCFEDRGRICVLERRALEKLGIFLREEKYVIFYLRLRALPVPLILLICWNHSQPKKTDGVISCFK